MQTYCGGPRFTIPEGMDYSPVSTYAYAGQYSGMNSLVRYTYGEGRVVLTGTHPELRTGTVEDWTFWDDHDLDNQPISNPDNPWELVDQLFNNWLILNGIVSVETGGGPDGSGQLFLAFPAPNPFANRVALSVRLPRAGSLRLTVHNVRGQLVSTLASEWVQAGEQRYEWNGVDDGQFRVPDGVYFVRMESNRQVQTRKVVLSGR